MYATHIVELLFLTGDMIFNALCNQIDREVPNGVKWLEEFLAPDDYEGYAEVCVCVSLALH